MQTDQQHTIQGIVERIVYHNEDNGYTVFALYYEDDSQLDITNYQDDDEKILTCTGHFADLHEGETVKVTGHFVNNPRYGWQLMANRAEKTAPNTLVAIEKYLGSGVIKGIGARMAKRIVDRFGADTLDVLESNPQKLAEMKGISLKRAVEFSEIFHSQTEMRQVMIFLHEYGISAVYAKKIYKVYKDAAIETIKQNPYKLADDIDGIGFKKADAIAYRLGISQESPERISAGVRFILWEYSNDGNVFIYSEQLTAQAAELLGVAVSLIDNELVRMQLARLIVREKNPENPSETLVFLSPLYYAEIIVARHLVALAAAHQQQNDSTIIEAKSSIAALEKETETELSDGQRQAILSALTEGVLVITGGPGTGKTTAINTLISLLTHQGFTISLAAPTGRAAKRMSEATGQDAKTIHRLLEVTYISQDSRRQVFNKNEDEPLETDVLIVDEASMMDILLMNSLLKAVPVGMRLILVGDVDQLPSVGAGNVLKDIISSNTVAVVRLTEIFRQAAQSAIITNAHSINQGQYPELNDREKDFFFVKRAQDDIAGTLLDLVVERLPIYKNCESFHDIQVLTPMRKSALGVSGLNGLLQAKLNPPDLNKKEREFGQTLFREGDKVMQVRNNYDATWEIFDDDGHLEAEGEGVFNGDMGIIMSIDDDKSNMMVQFDDNRQVVYDFTQLDELELAYAVTVHKSQGSEYRVVVMPIFGGPPMLMTRNLLYTAVTRAKELCVLVGVPECLHRMVDNNRIATRCTALARRLADLYATSSPIE